MYHLKTSLLFVFCLAICNILWAQQTDSLRKVMAKETLLPVASKTDTIDRSSIKAAADTISLDAQKPILSSTQLKQKPKHTPQEATLRSIIFPGLGQAYNHEYWKVPLAVAAVGIPVYLFISNNKEYKKARFAYSAVFKSLPISQGGSNDPSEIAKMDPKFKTYYDYEVAQANGSQIFLTSVQSYRNQFRQYRDYSLLAILLGWGLNVADATVFGHLRDFDVGPDLSMRVSPTYFQFARIPGIAFNFTLK